MQLITQTVGNLSVTISQNEMPVITPEFESIRAATAMAVNFIRSGTPGVQIALAGNLASNTEMYDRITDWLSRLKTGTEKFQLDAHNHTGVIVISKAVVRKG